MIGFPPPLHRFLVCAFFCSSFFPSLLFAIPTAVNDAYTTAEDVPLVVSNTPLIDADFEESSSTTISFDGNWDYLDEIENQNGSNDPYPVDSSGNAWNSIAFNPATSTVGTWSNRAMPLQSGGIDGFDGASDFLAGIGAAGNGENLVSTYLFRNFFTLTAAQAAESDWLISFLIDDGFVMYINGVEVDRFNLPAGAISTTSLAPETGNEGNYSVRALSLGGLLVAGTNVIAVEVHQTTLTSSDIGIDLSLSNGVSGTAGFIYQGDFFGTFNPNRNDGGLAAGEGFNDSNALNIELGRGNFFEGGAKSGAWTRDFELDAPGTVQVSFRYRQLNEDALDDGEFTQVILDVDGTRYGDDTDSSVSHLADGGDSGWQQETRSLALSAGSHTLALGFYNNSSRRNSEFANVWFDDVVLQFAGGTAGVLENDTGAAGDVTAQLVTNPSNGTLVGQADGTFIYTPNANFSGTDAFTYNAVDATGSSNNATVVITITPVNDPPQAVPDAYATAEDVALSVPALTGVLANDSDVENQALSASVSNQPEHGSVELDSDGSFLYTPAADFFGTDTFGYMSSDGAASSVEVPVTITISAADDAPIANPDSYLADENIPLVISESGSGDLVFSTNFDSGLVPELSGGGGLTSVEGFAGIGQVGNEFVGQYFRNATGVASNGVQPPTVLTLTNLPAHTSLTIEFLFALLDTWNGIATTFESDTFVIQVDGVTVFSQFFDEDPADQSYVAPAGAQLTSGSGIAAGPGLDNGYDMALEAGLRDIPHTDSTATITFFAGGNDWDGGDDESWAMDNLRVSVGDTPRDIIFPRGAVWSFLDDGSDLGTTWLGSSFDDSAWQSGNAKLGYGEGDEVTLVDFGPDENNKYITTYFRREFNIADPSLYSALSMEIRQDDGSAVYLNGTEIARTNLAPNADAGEFADAALPSSLESFFFRHTVDSALLVTGTNVLAVEVHQATPTSSDLALDFSMAGITSRSAGGVLANDIELDGQLMAATLVSNASNGSVMLNSDGTFTYTPGLNFHGSDSFTYAATDGSLSSNSTVTITVIPGPNDIPETVADNYSGTEDETLVVNAANGVLSNDEDPDDDPLTAALVTPASNGTVSLNADGSFGYVPDANFAGVDTFQYIANDTIDDSAATTVTLTITNVPDRPVAVDDVYIAQPGSRLDIPALGYLANDIDGDAGTVLNGILVGQPSSGTFTFTPGGSFSYTPSVSTSGSVNFTYRVSDGGLQSIEAATVTIHVNARPSAGGDFYLVVEDAVLNIGAPGVLGNDSDDESSPLSAVLLGDASNGAVSLAADGSFTYTPEADFSGADSFTYAANDGLQNSFPVTVSINVSAVNDQPVATGDEYTVLADTATSIPVADGVLSNDVDVDGPTLTASPVADVSNGVLNLAADGSFTYTPIADFTGIDSFTYLATDGTLDSAVTTVTLAVVAAADSILISEIMYHPQSENNAEEFVELFNRGDAPIDVGGWQFTSGINFVLPSVVIPPGGYLVVAADSAVFTNTYGSAPLLVGGWTGGLSNRGERIRLVDATGTESDDITYADQGDWAERRSFTSGGQQGWEWFAQHDGEGSSLELVNVELGNRRGQNWTASAGAPTPGAANSVADTDTAPLVFDVKHRPAVPKPTEPVTITAELKGIDGSTLSATLFHRISVNPPGGFTSSPMFDDGQHGDGESGDGEFGILLPAESDRTVVEFYVSVSNGTNTRTWPAPTNTGQNANALFQFDDEEFTGSYSIYRTIISDFDEDRFPFDNRQSNAELNATFIADNCGDISVRYQAGLRIRGASSRNDTPPPVRVNLASDRPWSGETRLNLNSQFTWLQFIGMKFFQASGLPAPDTKRIAMRRNGSDRSEQGEEGYGSIVHVQPLQEEFLDSHLVDSGGNLYKKTRPDNNWAYREGNVQDYLNDGWNKQTNASENDWSDLDEWLRVMNEVQGEADYIAQVEAVANLDQWMQWLAVMTILNNGETNASNGTDDDYSIYRGLDDTRFIFIPHDLDTILGQGDGSSITNPESTIFDMIERADELEPLIPLFQDAGVLTRYYQALREQLQTTFSVEQFDAMLDNHLTGWVPQDVIGDLKSYMDTRRAYITGLVDAQLGAPPALTPGITDGTFTAPRGDLYISEVLASNVSTIDIGGGVFPDFIELHNSGSSPVNLSGFSVSDDPANPQRYVFPAGSTINPGAYQLLRSDLIGFGLDTDGDLVTLYNAGGGVIDTISFGPQPPDLSISRTGAGLTIWALTNPTISTANAQPHPLGDPDSLKINEWLVRPQVTFDKDFVELYNAETLPVALGGLVITDEPVADPQRHSLPPLSFIAGSGFSVLYPVGSGSATGGSELPYKLSADHGWLSISGSNGIEIDEIHYICQRNDIAFGRETDGASIIVDFDLPTPGFSNATDLSTESQLLESLRITEIMYHPIDGDLEFLRLKNIGSGTINLGGIRMSNGVAISFPAVDLAPGESGFIVRDQAAYEAAFGTAGVLGEYTGALSNGGERLRLEITSLGYGILDFEYNDTWYTVTDGHGASLGIIDEGGARASWGKKESWQPLGGDTGSYDGWAASQFNSGDESIIGRNADPDQDGFSNAAEYAMGLDPNAPNGADLLGVAIEGDFLTLTYPRSKTATAQWQVESAGDVGHWQPDPTEVMLSDDGNVEVWKATDTTPITATDKRFMRVKITVP